MDLCGPYPVQGPRGEKYFFNILDDKTNYAFTFGIRPLQKKDQTFLGLSSDCNVYKPLGVGQYFL